MSVCVEGMSVSRHHIHQLPDDLLVSLFHLLSVEEACALSPVCRKWQHLLILPAYWTTLWREIEFTICPLPLHVKCEPTRPTTPTILRRRSNANKRRKLRYDEFMTKPAVAPVWWVANRSVSEQLVDFTSCHVGKRKCGPFDLVRMQLQDWLLEIVADVGLSYDVLFRTYDLLDRILRLVHPDLGAMQILALALLFYASTDLKQPKAMRVYLIQLAANPGLRDPAFSFRRLYRMARYLLRPYHHNQKHILWEVVQLAVCSDALSAVHGSIRLTSVDQARQLEERDDDESNPVSLSLIYLVLLVMMDVASLNVPSLRLTSCILHLHGILFRSESYSLGPALAEGFGDLTELRAVLGMIHRSLICHKSPDSFLFVHRCAEFQRFRDNMARQCLIWTEMAKLF